MSSMARIWRNRIIAGDKLFIDCPVKYKNDVKYLLRQDVKDGVITPEQYEEYTDEPYEE